MGMMINRRRACGGKKGLLPSGYTQLEYIENISDAYIDTGYKFTSDIIEFGTHIQKTGGTFLFVGNYNNNNTQFRFELIHEGVNSAYLLSNGAYSIVNIGNYAHIFTTFYYNNKNCNITLNEETNSCTISKDLKYNSNKILIGKRPSGVQQDNVYSLFKIWSLYIKEDDILTLNLIPCINPNNVVGMYDTVGQQFYSSPNGTAFVAGPEV